jgi:hypothetical protein
MRFCMAAVRGELVNYDYRANGFCLRSNGVGVVVGWYRIFG